MSKAKVYFETYCKVHGKKGERTDHEAVRVPQPNGRAKRKAGGCPICKREGLL